MLTKSVKLVSNFSVALVYKKCIIDELGLMASASSRDPQLVTALSLARGVPQEESLILF